MQKFKNSLFMGLCVGLVLPVIVPLLLFLMQDSPLGLMGFFKEIYAQNLLLKALSLGAMFNLGAFFLFSHQLRVKVAQGVILATIIYAVWVIVAKFF